MKSLPRFLSATVLGLAVLSATLPASAQDAEGGRRRNREGGPGGQGGPGGGGNWDPAQMRQRMMERMREQFAVTDDAEWKLISERIEKVNTARMSLASRGGFGFGGGGRGPGGQGGGGGGQGGRGGMFGEVSPEQEALQKAVESNAPADEIKTKLAKFRASQKDKEAKLEKAQDDLRQVLSAKQEATAVLLGLLK
jgi:hypothetical protein